MKSCSGPDCGLFSKSRLNQRRRELLPGVFISCFRSITPFRSDAPETSIAFNSGDSMQTIEDVLTSVDGWLNPKEAWRLYRLARECRGRGAIVEIGSWKGKSTICLARGSIAGGKAKINAIDPHTGSPEHSREFGVVWTFDEFRRNIE